MAHTEAAHNREGAHKLLQELVGSIRSAGRSRSDFRDNGYAVSFGRESL